jgi:hypothetical protein
LEENGFDWQGRMMLSVLVELGDQAGKAFTVEIEDLNEGKEILGFRLVSQVFTYKTVGIERVN